MGGSQGPRSPGSSKHVVFHEEMAKQVVGKTENFAIAKVIRSDHALIQTIECFMFLNKMLKQVETTQDLDGQRVSEIHHETRFCMFFYVVVAFSMLLKR